MSYKPYRGAGYYGRRRRKVFILILLLAVFSALFLFLYAQEWIVFTADGFRFSFSRAEKDPEPPAEPDDPPELIIEDPVEPPDSGQSPDTTDPDEPEPQAEALYGLTVSGAPELVSQSLTGSANALAVNIRGEDGVSALDEALTEAVSGFAQSGGRAVAMASALRDNTAPREDLSIAVTTGSGARWLDYDYISWVNPYSENAADTLALLANACAQAGFEELVLYNFQFPTHGKTQLIDYGEQAVERTQALSNLLSALRDKVPDSLGLSVVLTDTAAASLLDEQAGQDVSLLARDCTHLYIQTSDKDTDLSALSDALEGTSCRPALLLSGSEPPSQTCDYILVP